MRSIKFFSFINRVACKAGVLCSALVLARPSYLSFPVAFMMAATINVPSGQAFVKKKTPALQFVNRAEHLLPAAVLSRIALASDWFFGTSSLTVYSEANHFGLGFTTFSIFNPQLLVVI